MLLVYSLKPGAKICHLIFFFQTVSLQSNHICFHAQMFTLKIGQISHTFLDRKNRSLNKKKVYLIFSLKDLNSGYRNANQKHVKCKFLLILQCHHSKRIFSSYFSFCLARQIQEEIMPQGNKPKWIFWKQSESNWKRIISNGSWPCVYVYLCHMASGN